MIDDLTLHAPRDGPHEQDLLLREVISRHLPAWPDAADQILDRLAAPPFFCVLESFPWVDVANQRRPSLIRLLASSLGAVSLDNAYGSRTATDDVQPLRPGGRDVTYSFDSEVHADESSKPIPEDVVSLWCVRPASAGGESLIWPSRDVLSSLREFPHGMEVEKFLREHQFPFGGVLRQPPRVLLATVLFGPDGVRYRRGGIDDAFGFLNSEPTPSERAALQTWEDAITRTNPFVFRLERGQVSFAMNRRTLHSRARFEDPARWVIRCRFYNTNLSNSHADLRVRWREG